MIVIMNRFCDCLIQLSADLTTLDEGGRLAASLLHGGSHNLRGQAFGDHLTSEQDRALMLNAMHVVKTRKWPLKSLLSSQKCDIIAGFVIVLATIMIGWEQQLRDGDPPENDARLVVFFWLEHMFLVIYVLERMLRFSAWVSAVCRTTG